VAIRLFIDGAAGTTGLEIRERLQGRDEFELLVLDDAQRKDEAARRDALHAADIAILCLPDDAAKEAVKLAEGSGTRIIDASSAHRVAEGWTYGFPELIGRDTIANAQFVSNPGCYPTGFLALIAPLVRADILSATMPMICYGMSGYSGGGKALIERFEAPDAPAFRTYSLGNEHKHIREMAFHAGLAGPPVFAPAVVPAFRGMIIDLPLTVHDTASGYGHERTRLALADFYRDTSVISVAAGTPQDCELLLERNAAGWDSMELFVIGDPGSHDMRLIARLDNLGKGASGAAIQNLNIMCGLPETTGLRL
jgi:N-acetyl-gamma-glutamyl-phosphate reductase